METNEFAFKGFKTSGFLMLFLFFLLLGVSVAAFFVDLLPSGLNIAKIIIAIDRKSGGLGQSVLVSTVTGGCRVSYKISRVVCRVRHFWMIY